MAAPGRRRSCGGAKPRMQSRHQSMGFGSVTQLRNFAKTCYRYSETHPNGPSAAAGSSSAPIFPGAEEIGVLLSGIVSKPLRNMAADAMKQFHTRATEAINLIQSGSQMLVDAHNNFLRTMQCVQDKEAKENRRWDHERRDDGQCMDEQEQAAA